MKKIILAAIVLVAAWFITVWQTGRVAVNTVEEQLEYLKDSMPGVFTSNLVWKHKGFKSAEGEIVLRGIEDDFSVTQRFTLSHGLLKSDFVGYLDFDIEGLSATRLYGAQGIRTEGSFGLGGFSFVLNLDALEFQDQDMVVTHSPLNVNAAGNDRLQQVELSLDAFQLMGPKSSVVFGMTDLTASAATEYDDDKRIIRQHASYGVGTVITEGSALTVHDEAEISIQWHKAGEGIELSYGVLLSELMVNQVPVSTQMELSYRGGRYEPLYEEFERLLEELEANPETDLNPNELSDRIFSNILTPKMELQLSVREGDFGAFGKAELDITFVGPDRALANIKDNIEVQNWLFDSSISGTVDVLPAMVTQQLAMQAGLDPATLPWEVSYSRETGLIVGGTLVVPPQAIPAPK